MNWKKIWAGIKIGLSITQHLEDSGLIKSGKIIRISNFGGELISSLHDSSLQFAKSTSSLQNNEEHAG